MRSEWPSGALSRSRGASPQDITGGIKLGYAPDARIGQGRTPGAVKDTFNIVICHGLNTLNKGIGLPDLIAECIGHGLCLL